MSEKHRQTDRQTYTQKNVRKTETNRQTDIHNRMSEKHRQRDRQTYTTECQKNIDKQTDIHTTECQKNID